MSKPKKLTSTELIKLDKELNRTETIYIQDGKYQVNIHKTFRNTDIEDMLLNYMNVLQALNKTPQDIDLKNSYSLYLTLILRHFTDLPIPDTNDVVELIKTAKVLTNTGIMTEVLNALPEDQLKYLTKRAKETSESLELLINDLDNTGQ